MLKQFGITNSGPKDLYKLADETTYDILCKLFDHFFALLLANPDKNFLLIFGLACRGMTGSDG